MQHPLFSTLTLYVTLLTLSTIFSLFVDNAHKSYYIIIRRCKMNERIEELRNALNLSQSKFGEALGVTRTAVCAWENGRRSISEQTIISICREFNVNRAWLVEGVGDMFTNLPETILDELALQYELTDLEKDLVGDFCKLPKEQRNIVITFLRGKK